MPPPPIHPPLLRRRRLGARLRAPPFRYRHLQNLRHLPRNALRPLPPPLLSPPRPDLVRRTKEAVSGEGGEIKAVIWFQGESDTLSEEAAAAYGRRLKELITDLRSDLGLPSLSFIQVAIASGNEGLVEKVREAQLGIDLPGVACVDAKGLPLNDDGLHLSTQGQVRLGRMLAEAYVDHFLPPPTQQ